MSIERVTPPTLDELAGVANAEHLALKGAEDRIRAAVSEGVLHAIRAGEALLAAQDLVPDGEWQRWVDANVRFHYATVSKYQRIAFYRVEVERWMADPQSKGSAIDAWKSLRGLPPMRSAKTIEPTVREEIAILAGTGLSNREIARVVGVSDVTVRIHTDPEYAKLRQRQARAAGRRRKAAKSALDRQEIAAEIKRKGGSLAVAYEHIRKLALALDAAMVETDEADERAEIREARSKVHLIDDAIVRASKLGRRTRSSAVGPRPSQWKAT